MERHFLYPGFDFLFRLCYSKRRLRDNYVMHKFTKRKPQSGTSGVFFWLVVIILTV